MEQKFHYVEHSRLDAVMMEGHWRETVEELEPNSDERYDGK